MKKTFTQFDKNDFEITAKNSLYKGRFQMTRYHIRHRLFAEGWSNVFSRDVFERASAAAVLPYDPKLDRVILIEQFRAGTIYHKNGPWVIEIPAGIIEDNLSPDQIAIKEAKEEADCLITELIPIYDFFISPGACNEYLNLYCGKADLSQVNGIFGLKHENEDIKVHNISFDEAMTRLAHGEIKTVPAIISLLWLQLNRNTL